MIRTIIRRVAIIPPALLLVHFLGFAYAHIVRPLRAARNPFLAAVTKPEPFWPTYTAYFKQVIQGDLGPIPPISLDSPDTIAEALVQTGSASLGLMGIALFLSIVIGVILGLYAARTEPPIIARWLSSISSAGLAMPSFFIGGLFFAAWFLYAKWTPPGQVLPLPLQGFGWDAHLVMPVIVLMLRPTVQIAQLTAGMLVEEFERQYIVAARSLGHSWRRIRWKDALRNIFAPVVLTIAGSVRLLVGELIVVEWLFSWPGLGSLLAQTLIPSGIAINVGSSDAQTALFLNPPVVAAVLVVFATVFLVTDLVASIFSQVFDPRLRES
jgi:ABC-type dipeptide/oligopeptide/nickel transport system permease component